MESHLESKSQAVLFQCVIYWVGSGKAHILIYAVKHERTKLCQQLNTYCSSIFYFIEHKMTQNFEKQSKPMVNNKKSTSPCCDGMEPTQTESLKISSYINISICSRYNQLIFESEITPDASRGLNLIWRLMNHN